MGIIRKSILLLLLFGACMTSAVQAQVPVEVSHQTQMVNGKKYYIHIVRQGQTVYSISRAYGLKAVDAVVKKDIHFLAIGDTVWLPCRGQQLPESTTSNAAPTSGGKSASSTSNNTVSATAAKPADSPMSASSTSSQWGKSGSDKASTQASSTSKSPASPRDRVSPNEVVVSLLMPLFLDQIDEISTTKFDIEQRGRKNYRSFEFIQFYEGILIGLDKLKAAGFSVRLNLVDVPDNRPETVERLFVSHNVAQSDFVIGLLMREPFQRLANLCRDNNLFVINPMATRSEILLDNPYVFKCTPSLSSRISAVIDYVQSISPKPHLLVIHSGAKDEILVRQEIEAQVSQAQGFSCTFVDWKNNGKLATIIKQLGPCVVLPIYDQGKDRNRLFAGNLLNRLISLKLNNLITLDDWTHLYSDVDFSQLQRLNYKTVYEDWDFYNISHQLFLGTFRDRYLTEPVGQFASMGNDIIVYFVTGLYRRGKAFWNNPNISQPKSMVNMFQFSQSDTGNGFENSEAALFELRDYQFRSLKSPNF